MGKTIKEELVFDWTALLEEFRTYGSVQSSVYCIIMCVCIPVILSQGYAIAYECGLHNELLCLSRY